MKSERSRPPWWGEAPERRADVRRAAGSSCHMMCKANSLAEPGPSAPHATGLS